MSNPRIDALRTQLGGPRDGALLRYALGAALSDAHEHDEAAAMLRDAVQRDPDYSAAWKLLGKVLVASNERDAAIDAYRRGIAAAERRGDVQAAKEMRVFLKRLEK